MTSALEIQSNRSSSSETVATAYKINEKSIDEIESYNEEKIDPDAYNYKTDPNHPINWPRKKKMSGLIVVSLSSFMGYFSSAVYMPATHDIMTYFQTDLTTINATISLFLLMNAVAPLFWAPLSERVGRRWVYIIAMAIYTVCTLVCAVSTNLGLFFVFRLLQGIFACAGQAVGGGSVSDIFEPQDRGKAMGIYILGTILGPAIAPIVGGYIDQYLGWRWIFYIKAIMGGCLTILSFIFIKETLYVPNTRQLPPPTSFKERFERLKFNPFGSLELLLLPDVAMICIPTSVAFGWFYFLVTTLPSAFGSIYGFPIGTIGLCYLSAGVGNISGSAVAGVINDKLYARAIAKNNGVAKTELRLRSIYIAMPFLTAGPLMYGWLLQSHVHWMGPLASCSIMTFGIMFTITVASAYMVDSNPTKAASVIAISNFTRNLCGMIFSLTSAYIRNALNDGWSFTMMAIFCLCAYLICIPIIQKYGAGWRAKRQ